MSPNNNNSTIQSSIMFSTTMQQQFMLRALAISHKALPKCQPNPPVGCVLVTNNEIVAEGFTQEIGHNHAEIEALKAYSSDMSDSIVGAMSDVIAYVTLEPCAFIGRTPACANAIIESGIKHVIVAMLDPDARNSGKGISILEKAGITVEVGLCHQQVSRFLSPYLNKSYPLS